MFEVLGLIFLSQALLYIIFLLSNSRANSERILIIFLGTLVLLFSNLFIRFHWIPRFPYFYYEFISILAPLQYFYTKSLVVKNFGLSFKDIWHFTGVLLLLTFRSIFMSDYLIAYGLEFEKIFFFPLFASVILYLIRSFKVIHDYHKTILQTRSNFEDYNLKWLKIELLILSVFFITMSIESLSLFIDFGKTYFTIVLISFLCILAFINILTFKSLKAPSIAKALSKEERYSLSTPKTKMEKSFIPNEASRNIYNQLILLMQTEKPHMEFGLSLSQLAGLINTSTSELSQIINHYSKMNFNDFVNSYRVESAKALMELNTKLLMKEIMYESGFQSTSTFNRVFKKMVGVSPTNYHNNIIRK